MLSYIKSGGVILKYRLKVWGRPTGDVVVLAPESFCGWSLVGFRIGLT
jgi:hypothetical protein